MKLARSSAGRDAPSAWVWVGAGVWAGTGIASRSCLELRRILWPPSGDLRKTLPS
ncbi:hypothetical protein JYU34_019558 [Plutella xylostella]|uniref:Uncharacterized protein n=1 Tax=Plutella xylostella TaxID=51655 RepID=A0ABQ7PX70_PLUXY|nr:hypothetical protein JYU34_019558 [Plutella xylostella]